MRYILLMLLGATAAFAQPAEFNADSAFADVEHLCVKIGPRPMGSANERAALKWAVEKFRRFGADPAYVMHVPEASGTINTNSGVAIGIFRGATDSTIVIGGHIDSAGREIPGANDDASGTACMIELARLWSQRERRFTLLFAAFGGEESGLVGSKYFAGHYADLDNVKLMLQIDMAGSDEALVPFLETSTHQAPEWLVEDAYAIDRALGYNSLQYPTHFFSFNYAFKEGFAGSDHESFLKKNIPAIDFTAGVNSSPIHTPQDRLEFIPKSMLARSGRLVDGLLNKYQSQGIPLAKKDNYMLWQFWGMLFFIPPEVLFSANVAALLLGGLAFYRSRKERLQIPKSARSRFSGLKLFVIVSVISVFFQFGEAALQGLKGLRYPWMISLNHYLGYAALWALAGIWLTAQLTRKWKFSLDPYVYAKRALLFLFMLTILFSLSSSRLAFYPALSLLALSLSILLPRPALKISLFVLAALPMIRLMFFEMFPLIARSLSHAGQGINTFFEAFLYSAILTVLLIFWYLPSIYHLAYTMASSPKLWSAFQAFRRPAVGLGLLLVLCGYGGYLYSLPVYNQTWRARVEADAEYELPRGKSKLHLQGNEYFQNVDVVVDTLKRYYHGRMHEAKIPLAFQADWLKFSGTDSVREGERSNTVIINWQIASTKPWFEISVKLKVDTLEINEINTTLKYAHRKDELTFAWYSEPPETLQVRAGFALSPGAKVIREVKAVYAETPRPMHVTAEFADVIHQTIVTYRDTVVFSATQPANFAKR